RDASVASRLPNLFCLVHFKRGSAPSTTAKPTLLFQSRAWVTCRKEGRGFPLDSTSPTPFDD
ncbi:hypothetical protein ACPV55_29520, partial [Vibrio mediterranei]